MIQYKKMNVWSAGLNSLRYWKPADLDKYYCSITANMSGNYDGTEISFFEANATTKI